jgi:hypothetical protein
MTSQELQEDINRLCLAVIQEQDPASLTKLLAELNELLERKQRKDNEGTCQTSPDVRTA